MKKILLMIVGVVLITPFFVSAQTAPTSDQFMGAQTTCLDLQYNMSYRSRDARTNGEVSDLQDFLNTNGYLSVEPTGYFGAATLTAVKKFQLSVLGATASTPGYGGVGPKSRAKIKEMTCGGAGATISTPSAQTISTTRLEMPAGCTSTIGFSPMTGLRCSTTNATTQDINTALDLARLKGADAAIKANLANARAQAELYYDATSQSYSGFCSDSISNTNDIGNIKKSLASIKVDEVICNDSAKQWAMSARLKSVGAGYWCVDNMGSSRATIRTLFTQELACPGANATTLTLPVTPLPIFAPPYVIAPVSVATSAPVITSITPSINQNGTVTITGSNFSATENYVQIDNRQFGPVASQNGASITLNPSSVSPTLLTPGTHTVNVIRNPGSWASNSVSLVVTATATQPVGDLIVQDLVWTPSTPTVSSVDPYIYFTLTVKNNGTGSMVLPSGTKFTLTKNGVLYGGVEIGTPQTLAQLETKTFAGTSTQSPNLRADAGIFTLILTADSTNLVPETNEGNNTISKTITIAPLASSAPLVSIATPTLSPSFPSLQFIVGGAQNVGFAQYNFVTINGIADTVISELKFTVGGTAVNPITQLCIPGAYGSVCAPVDNNVAYFTGLNIATANGSSGTNVTVNASFAPVGVNGVISNTTANISLTYMKYATSGIPTINSSLNVPSKTYTLWGTKPVVAATGGADPLMNGIVKVMEITVMADAAGDVKLTQLPINVTSIGVASITSGLNNIVVRGIDGVMIPTTNGTFGVTAGGNSGDTAIAFTNGYLVHAGTSKIFKIYVTASTVSGPINTTFLSAKIGAPSLFIWTDQVGGVSGITGYVQGI